MKLGGIARGRDNMRSELPFGFILGKGADKMRRPPPGVTHSILARRPRGGHGWSSCDLVERQASIWPDMR
jgi:hypothetical protein